MRRPRGVIELANIQKVILQRIFDDGKSLAASDLAKLADSWDRLEERRRIIKGQPLPGALRPTAAKPKRTQHSKLLIDSVDSTG